MTEKTEKSARIEIARIDAQTLTVPIIGTAGLIVNKFSEKAKRAMLDSMTGEAVPKKIRDPAADYQAAFHRTKGGEYGFPVVAFKAATIGAARFYGNKVSMTELRQFIFLAGEISDDGAQSLVVIHGEPRMREDYVRVGQTTDLRYRPEFTEWSTTLTITYVKSALSQASVLSLVDAGGMGGVGELRPAGKKSSGEFGTYKIDQTKTVEVIS